MSASAEGHSHATSPLKCLHRNHNFLRNLHQAQVLMMRGMCGIRKTFGEGFRPLRGFLNARPRIHRTASHTIAFVPLGLICGRKIIVAKIKF